MLKTKAFIPLIVLFPGLGYSGFTYVRESHVSDLGSLQPFVNEERRMNAPVWLGFGALVTSGALLLFAKIDMTWLCCCHSVAGHTQVVATLLSQ